MIRRRTPVSALALAVLGLTLACGEDPVSPAGDASDPALDAPDTNELEAGATIPFADLEIFLEHNATDGDLGVQVFLDAEDWERISAFAPDRANVLQIRARGELGELGITELRFESAEPSPEEVLALFAPGEYRFEGRTVEGDRLVGAAPLSHDLAPAPAFTPADGDEVDPEDTVIEWTAIPGLRGYEIIVSNEDSGLSLTVELGPGATRLRVPPEFMEPGAEYKAEVLAILPNGNKTITEHSFTSGS